MSDDEQTSTNATAGDTWNRLEEWCATIGMPVLGTILLVALLTAGAGYALFGTEQGRDLLQVSADFWPGVLLFGGISFAVSMNAYFAWTLLAHDTDINRLFNKLILFVSFSVFVAIILTWWYTGSLLMALTVWLLPGAIIGVFISALFNLRTNTTFADWSARLGLSLSILFLLVSACWPGYIGHRLGSPALLGFLLIAWSMLVVSLITLAIKSGAKRPSLRTILLVVLGVLAGREILHIATAIWLRHPPLDLVSTANVSIKPALPTLESAYHGWRDRQSDKRPQLVLIAAAGGGIRASFWTSHLIARLADRVPNFQGKLFAASGVSGGSLGLGVTYALLSSNDGRCFVDKEKDPKKKNFETCAHRFHQRDLLAGPLGATLAGYPANLLVPWFSSRSQALEYGFERSLRKSVEFGSDAADKITRPLSELWGTTGSHPLLLLNATLASSGERAMAADVDVRPWMRWRTKCQINLAETVMPTLGAAIGASARFPLVTDPGWVDSSQIPGCSDLEAVADGGYFDNYGAATLIDLLDGLSTVKPASDNKMKIDLAKDLKLVVIQITSDPSRDMGCLFTKLNLDQGKTPIDFCSEPARSQDRDESKLKLALRLPNWLVGYDRSDNLYKTLSAISPSSGYSRSTPSMMDVFLQTRSINGIEIAEQLRTRTCALEGSYYHFAMTGAKAVPLGWALSSYSQGQLEALLESGRGAELFGRLVNELQSGEKKGQC